MNLIKCLKSFKFAFNGIKLVLQENNTRFHVTATILALILGFSLSLKIQEWLWVLSGIFSVWIAETFNTAIEKLTNLASPDYHPLAGEAKDLAAGTVLIASIYAAIVGFLIFGSRIMVLLGEDL